MPVLRKKKDRAYGNIVQFLNDEGMWKKFDEYYDTEENFKENREEHELEDMLKYAGSDMDAMADLIDEYWDGFYHLRFNKNRGYIHVIEIEMPEKEPEVEPPKIEPGDDCPNKNCKGTLKQAEVLYGDDILQCKECGQPVDIPTD